MAYSNDSSTEGYGSFSSTLFQLIAVLTHYGPDGSPSQSWGGVLLVMMDTTPGQEFFSYTVGPTGAEIYQGNQTLVLFRTPSLQPLECAFLSLRGVWRPGLFQQRPPGDQRRLCEHLPEPGSTGRQ